MALIFFDTLAGDITIVRDDDVQSRAHKVILNFICPFFEKYAYSKILKCGFILTLDIQ